MWKGSSVRNKVSHEGPLIKGLRSKWGKEDGVKRVMSGGEDSKEGMKMKKVLNLIVNFLIKLLLTKRIN